MSTLWLRTITGLAVAESAMAGAHCFRSIFKSGPPPFGGESRTCVSARNVSFQSPPGSVSAEKRKRCQKRCQSTSLSQPLFFEKVSGMEGASPLKSGFFNSEFAVRSGVNSEPDFYDQKRVVTFRVLLFRPLQTGLTRHRFRASHERVRVPLSSASLKRGTERPGCILTLAIACA